ncbi:hypothetical protein quinque_015839 [Culex quinquefasciatus]
MIQFCLTVLLLLVSPVLSADWSASCAAGCTCKWSNGKKSALCNASGFGAIPANLSAELQVLVLNENRIAVLDREVFTGLGLGNLQRIHLKRSGVRRVDSGAFSNLNILIEVDLSENEIEELDRRTFAGNNRLRIINLSENPLKVLVADQFPVLPYLRNIDLHGCELREVAETAFSNLELLEFLDLSRNRLEGLPRYVFNHMKNLKTLMLEENPWRCDCRLREFRSWYVGSTHRKSLSCTAPFGLKDAPWETVPEEDFGCMPQLEIYRDDATDIEDLGANITYRCVGYGDPEPEVVWDLNGKIVDQDNMMTENERVVKFDGNVTLWSNLTILNITSNDSGYYTCTARNKIGFLSKNFSLILPEVVERVIIKTPETFWYFGLILGIFGTIFGLLSLSVVICLCKRKLRTRRRKKNIKSSVSFNDQEKKLLDLSITTNERQEFSASDVMTPSTKTDSTIAMEPVQITIESIAKREEFPLNVGVFPPPPEFCSQMVPNPAYGNIFISVSVTAQDALDNPDLNMYPDLLNIPNRATSKPGKLIPVNVSSYATLPRKNPRHQVGTPSGSSQPPSLTAVPPPTIPQQQHAPTPPPDSIVNYSNIEESCEITGLGSPVPAPPQTMCQECIKLINAGRPLSRFSRAELVRRCENSSFPCLKYDNMGRRYTAAGNSTLSLPGEDPAAGLEQESIFIQSPPPPQSTECETIAEVAEPVTPTAGPSHQTTTAAIFVTGNDFVSL